MPAHRPAPFRLPALAALALSGAMLFAGACNIVAPVGYLVHGPEKIPALHELDTEKVTVVFIDDTRASVLPSRAVRRRIGEAAEQVLLNEADVERVKSSLDVMAVADREKYSKEMGIAELGAAVGAEVVVYVAMQSFAIVQAGEQFQPIASASVRVVDVATRNQLWPDDLAKSYNLVVEAPPRTSGLPSGSSERTRVHMDLADRFGRAIGHIFVRHEKRPQTGRLDH